MAKEMILKDSQIIPASELISHTILGISDTVKAANEVLIQKENFKKFSSCLEKVSFILRELSNVDLPHTESLESVLGVLNREVNLARQLALECNSSSRVYLLINCRNIVKRLEYCTKDISQAVKFIFIPPISLDTSSGLNEQISELCQHMEATVYQAAVEDEEILEKIESAIQEGNVDRSCVNKLLACIADVSGMSTEQDALMREFKELKRELERAKSRKDMVETLHIEQIISFLEKADFVTSMKEKEKKYFEKRNSLGRRPLEALQSFYCPICLDIMVDPVEIASGKTFERSAIEKWFAEGNNHCPLTMLPLDTSILRPNKTLRQSIQEWKDRNNIITISNIKSKLQTDEEEEVLQSLDKLHELSMEKEIHREYIKMENYFSVLVGLLAAKNREVRKRVLLILSLLAKDNEENKEDIAKVDNALQLIVRSLARQIGESKLALELLLELSRSNVVRDLIGNVQGSILLLVTMLSSNDNEAAKNAYDLLGNLSFLDQNVIQMAKANYLKPLLQNLFSGSENMRILMAETLSEIELTDHNKLSIIKDGALQPLLQLLSNNDMKVKEVAVRALLKLSILPENGLQMIREGVAKTLFELLFHHSLESSGPREWVAATVMHLAISTMHQKVDEEQVSLLDSEEDIFKFFSLISFTGPNIQSKILKAFQAMCQAPSGFTIRSMLRQISAAQVLVHLLEHNSQAVQSDAVKLFYCLTEVGDCSSYSSYVTEGFIKILLTIFEASDDDPEEQAAAMGIISRLPQESQITQWLLDFGALQTILACLMDPLRHSLNKIQVIENCVQALCRFTVSTNLEWQKRVAHEGIIPVLVQLLVSGTPLSKQNAAISIKQFSENSYHLSRPIKNQGIFKCCLVAHEVGCPVHLGRCTVESSFCILEANALGPLVRMLTEQDVGICEASLDALLTLLGSEILQSGSKVLADANAIDPMIKVLSLPAPRIQEKTLIALERILQSIEIKNEYKSMATMTLIGITQSKDSRLRSLAAKVLAQLGVINKQSSYF